MDTKVFDTKYKKLNKRQKEAVDQIYGPVMVVAGPGTGKTTVLTMRIANILRLTDAKPDEILALTFTDSGVKAMREKLRELIGDASFRINIHTFHSFANFMRGLFPHNFSRIGGRLPCSEIDQVEIIHEILEENSFKEIRPRTFGIKIRDIVKRISELKRELIAPADILKFIREEEREIFALKESAEKKTKTFEKQIESREKYVARLKEFVTVFEVYEKKLEEKKLYDFDDTILGLIEAIEEHEDMALEMRESFQFVLADEHQDANAAQNKILQSFHDKSFDESPNLFIVGDDKQSIFRFQGANLEHFFTFKKEFKDALSIDLEDNYRSQKHILDIAHNLISHDGQIHTPLLSNVEHKTSPIRILECKSERFELETIAHEIKAYVEKHKGESVAVLARNNSALFRLAPFLQALEVDYNLKGEVAIFDTLEYKKIWSLLAGLSNPFGSPEFMKAVFFGFFKTNIRDMLLVADEASKTRKTFAELFLSKSLRLDLEDKQSFVEVQKTINLLIDTALKKPLLDFLKTLKEHIVLYDKSEVYDVLKVLFDEAQHLVLKKRHALLADFVAHLKLIEEHGVMPLVSFGEKESSVVLSSIHKSKGLEYDKVHIISFTSKDFEQASKKADLLKIPGIGISKELSEERRLLYVAITRAKKHATISFSLESVDGKTLAPSMLLDELHKDLVVREVIDTEESISLLDTKQKENDSLKALLLERFAKRNFSVTALNNYLECPYKYIFRNLLQIPDIKEFSALLGTATHETLRRFHLKQKKHESIDKKEIKKIIEEEVTRQPFSKKDLSIALDKVEESVLTYVDNFKGFGETDEVFVEESLTFPFTFEVEGEKKEILVNGKIDLAIKEGSRVEVIDFKSKKRMTPNAIKGLTSDSNGNEYRQLQFYKMLWSNANGEDEVTQGTLTFMTPERKEILRESFALTAEDLQEITDTVLRVVKEISTGEFLSKRCDDEKCEFCRSGLI